MEAKERIAQEAMRLFALRGVDAVGVQEIVEAAELTKPTLYHHFGSKEGLLRSLVDGGFGVLTRALDALGPWANDLPGYLERQAGVWVDVVRAQPDWFRVEMSLSFLPPGNPGAQVVRPGLEALARRFEALFEAASVPYGNMRGRHRLVAAGWLATLYHFTSLSLGGWTEPDPALIKAGTRQFLYGVFT